MPRGSGDTGKIASGPSGPVVEMLGESGQLTNQGKIRVRKKFFVTNQADLSKAADLPGYKPTGITYNKVAGGAYEQEVEYAAQIDPNQSPIVETLQGLSGTFETMTSYERIPIAQHPRIADLLIDYGGYTTDDGEPRWPQFYTDGDGNQKRNPMYGVKTWKVPTMTFRHTYTVKGMPPRTIYDKAGDVVTSLPAGFPTPKGPVDSEGNELKLRWLMLVPALFREGDTTRIVQEYELIDAAPGMSDIYETTGTPGSVGP